MKFFPNDSGKTGGLALALLLFCVLGFFPSLSEGLTCGLFGESYDWTMGELQYMSREELMEQYCIYSVMRNDILKDTILAADHTANVMACDRMLGNISRVLRKDHQFTAAVECDGAKPKEREKPQP